MHSSQNRTCLNCNLIDNCKTRFEQKLKLYVTISKKRQYATIDYDLGHFAIELNDSGILKMDSLFAKFADEKSSFEHGASSGIFKIPKNIHADFYRSLLRIFTTPENLQIHNNNYCD